MSFTNFAVCNPIASTLRSVKKILAQKERDLTLALAGVSNL